MTPENPLKGRDILAIGDLNPDEIRLIFDTADQMLPYARREKRTEVLKGAILGNLFLEASTRSRISFGAAFNLLGGTARDTAGAETTSMAKGESVADTARAVSGYVDIIVLRHADEDAVGIMAEASQKPVINAGNGTGEHPTQALLDVYTIEKRIEDPNGTTIAIVGDLLNGRTTHSLVRLMGKLYENITFKFIAPQGLEMPQRITNELQDLDRGHSFEFSDQISEISGADVIYATRTQEERFPSPQDAKKYRGKLRIDKATVDQYGKDNVVIMHPLPRDSRENANELDHDLDGDSRLAIFEQTDNGIPIRMAIFALVLDVADRVEETAQPVTWHVPPSQER